MADLADLGVTGLAVMGANLARNAARKGFHVALHNRSNDKTDHLIAEHGKEGKFTATHSIEAFVAALAKPRVILIMVKAGKPIDDVIAELVPHLEAGDIIVDGGNLFPAQLERRRGDAAELNHVAADLDAKTDNNCFASAPQATRAVVSRAEARSRMLRRSRTSYFKPPGRSA